MRSFLIGLLILSATLSASAQATIRQVDFKNFTYPLSRQLLGHSQLQWLDPSGKGSIQAQFAHLVNGKDTNPPPSFSLQSVEYADVTGEGKEDAVIVLRYGAADAVTAHYIYIYSIADRKPKLLAFCHFGTHGYSSLLKAYGGHGQLIIDSAGPNKTTVRGHFVWKDGRFQLAGAPETVPAKP